MDKSQKSRLEFFVEGSDSAKLFQIDEQFNLVPLLFEFFVIIQWSIPVGPRRNNSIHLAIFQWLSNLIAILGLTRVEFIETLSKSYPLSITPT